MADDLVYANKLKAKYQERLKQIDALADEARKRMAKDVGLSLMKWSPVTQK